MIKPIDPDKPKQKRVTKKIREGINRRKYTLYTVAFVTSCLLMFTAADYFFDRYDIGYRNPVSIKVQSPITVTTRRVLNPVVEGGITPTSTPVPSPTVTPTVGQKKKVSRYSPSDQEIIDYIKSKDWDDATAIKIAKSENFWNLTKSFDCGRDGAMNKNGTKDHGLWQINDIHIKSGAISLEDTYNCFKATDFAYRLYKARGNFTAWMAYTNLSYLNHSE